MTGRPCRHLRQLAIGLACMAITTLGAAEPPRLAVLTDVGGDPDDQQSLIRLMLYTNELDLELMIASASGTPGELTQAITRPDLIRQIVDAYGQVLPNLRRHASGWPAADILRGRIVSGKPRRGLAHIGADHDTAASRALIERVDAGTSQRPLNIAVWGGQTDLAQALWRVKHDRGASGLATFVSRLRVYDIADQDGLADWMHAEFPGLFYILTKAPAGRDRRQAVFRGMYLTGDESLTSRAWLEQYVRNRGPLGALYPTETWTAPNPHGAMKEGDTPSWFFFLPMGGNEPSDPTKPGWGGQFIRDRDGRFRDPPAAAGRDPRESVSRWRPAFQRDFARRMAWCVSTFSSPGLDAAAEPGRRIEIFRRAVAVTARPNRTIVPGSGTVCAVTGPHVDSLRLQGVSPRYSTIASPSSNTPARCRTSID